MFWTFIYEMREEKAQVRWTMEKLLFLHVNHHFLCFEGYWRYKMYFIHKISFIHINASLLDGADSIVPHRV